jgi:hypothetical protein
LFEHIDDFQERRRCIFHVNWIDPGFASMQLERFLLGERSGHVGDQLGTTIRFSIDIAENQIGGSDAECIDVVVEYAAECMLRCCVEIERTVRARIRKLQIRPAGHETRTSAHARSFEQLAAEGDVGFDEREDVATAMFSPGQCREMKYCIGTYRPNCIDERFGASIQWMQPHRHAQSGLEFVNVLPRESVNFYAGTVKLLREFLTDKTTDSADDCPLHKLCSLGHEVFAMLASVVADEKSRARREETRDALCLCEQRKQFVPASHRGGV